MGKPRVVILGAGPAGLGAAFRLARQNRADVTVLERNAWVGGNAGSFELDGLRVDYGSHRLHPACDPAVLGDIRELLGDDLLDRPRHGRIRVRGRWIHFPLKPLDLALRLPPDFALGVATDTLRKLASRGGPRASHRPAEESFASVLQAGLGETLCRNFYFPYARKIWGLDPEELSATQAHRRVSADSVVKMLGKVVSSVPGFKSPTSGRFFYPRHGYGQICEAYAQAVEQAGAEIRLGCQVISIDTGVRPSRVQYERAEQVGSIEADYVWSTIPVTLFARALKPAPPPEYLRAAGSIDFRAMILIYLVLEQDRFSEYDAHYFPEDSIPIARCSEPKTFSAGQGPPNRTVLCAELPCASDGPEWHRSDEELGKLACEALAAAGIPVRAPLSRVVTRRLRNAYPIYRRGFEAHLEQLDRWIGGIEGVLTFGRQGLFSHDNLHHALYVGYSAAACVDESGGFDHRRWECFRRIFETHVVED